MRDVTILGAGLVGPALALQLAQQGRKIVLFERGGCELSTDYNSGRSVNMTLCARGLKALAATGSTDEILACTVPIYGRSIHHPDGHTSFEPYGPGREALYSIRRNDLRNLLLKRLVQQGKVRLLPYSECGELDLKKKTFSVFDQNRVRQTIAYEQLLGADGVNSVVRKTLEAADLVRSEVNHHEVGYRELSLPAGAVSALGLELNAIHIWPRGPNMLLGLPNLDGSITLSLFLPIEGSRLSWAKIKSPHNSS